MPAESPPDAQPFESLAREAEARGDLKEAVRLRDAWAARTSDPVERGRILKASADLLVRVDKDPGAARGIYERALASDPDQVEGWEALQRVGEALGEPPLVANCIEKRAALARNDTSKVALLLELGEFVEARLDDAARAGRAYEAAFRIEPRSPVAARAALARFERTGRTGDALVAATNLLEVALETDDAGAALDALVAIGRAALVSEEEPPRSVSSSSGPKTPAVARARGAALAAFALAPQDLAVRKLLAASLAAHVPEVATDPVLVDATLHVATTLEGSLDTADDELLAIARLHAFELSNKARAQALVHRILAKNPGHAEALAIAVRLEGATTEILHALRHAPPRAEPWRALSVHFVQRRMWDRAAAALDVVAALGGIQPAERASLALHPPVPTSDIPGTLLPAAWTSHLLHPSLDVRLAALFRLLAPALVPIHPPSPTKLSPALAPLRSRLESTARDASEILALETPLHAWLDPRAERPIVTASRGAIFLLVSPTLAERLGREELAYVVGRAAAAGQAELLPRTLAATPSDLDELLHLAARAVGHAKGPPEPKTRSGRWPTPQHLAAMLRPDDHAEIVDILRPLDTMELATNATGNYWAFADASAARVGLVLSGSIGASTRAELAFGRAPSDLDADRWFSELAVFAVSSAYAELREALGVSRTRPL